MSAPWQKIVVCSSDKEIVVVEEEVMLHSEVIKNMILDGCFNKIKIPMLNVDKKTLTKVIRYCFMHTYNKNDHLKDALKKWDAEFANVDPYTLYDLMMAAECLEIKSLHDLLLESIANTINEKSVEEICETFTIKNDFTLTHHKEEQLNFQREPHRLL
ncbi:SKP1-like protein 11 [Gastrolobium bilobum]|uniref:SKP1-like protein 11 n=1 Tax=Gastrolobium bilobum TaxID=150636 RepID=UPI002AB09041|nr:SKP1-like protein 11 [Gastrolobium bilobum]